MLVFNIFSKPKIVPIPEDLQKELDKLDEETQEQDVFYDAECIEPQELTEEYSKKKNFFTEKKKCMNISAGSMYTKPAPKESSIVESLEDYLDKQKLEKTFNELLFEFIDKSGLTDAEVYKKAAVDRRTFSKIRTGAGYHPSKGTVLQLCLALELSIDDALDLLKAADYYIQPNCKENVIIYYLFKHKHYDLMYANNTLYSVCQKTVDQL